MKFKTATALVLLAEAGNIDARFTGDKFEISNFSAACGTIEDYDNWCTYSMDIVSSWVPEFKSACDVQGESDNGELPAVKGAPCGTYKAWVIKRDGGLYITIVSSSAPLWGNHFINNSDLEMKKSDKGTKQSYKGPSNFTIDCQQLEMADPSEILKPGIASLTPTMSLESTAASASLTSLESSAASSILSTSPTVASQPFTTGTTTSSISAPSQTNSAVQNSVLAGTLFSIGLMSLKILLI